MSLQQDWRARAAELEKQLPTLLAADGVNKAQVAATVASVLREWLGTLADAVDLIEQTKHIGDMASRLNSISAQNNAVRLAGAKALVTGDWSDFTKVAFPETPNGDSSSSGQPGSNSGSSTAAPGGDQATAGAGGGAVPG